MTVAEITGLVVALSSLVASLGIVLHNIAELRKDLNGRLQELIDARVEAAQKRGELDGRDFVHRLLSPPREDAPS